MHSNYKLNVRRRSNVVSFDVSSQKFRTTHKVAVDATTNKHLSYEHHLATVLSHLIEKEKNAEDRIDKFSSYAKQKELLKLAENTVVEELIDILSPISQEEFTLDMTGSVIKVNFDGYGFLIQLNVDGFYSNGPEVALLNANSDVANALILNLNDFRHHSMLLALYDNLPSIIAAHQTWFNGYQQLKNLYREYAFNEDTDKLMYQQLYDFVLGKLPNRKDISFQLTPLNGVERTLVFTKSSRKTFVTAVYARSDSGEQLLEIADWFKKFYENLSPNINRVVELYNIYK